MLLGHFGIVPTRCSADVAAQVVLAAYVCKLIMDSGQMVVVHGLLSTWDITPGWREVHCTQTAEVC